MIARVLLWLIRCYQRALSPLLGATCRFHPSCSHYTAVCIERFGAGRGLLLGAKRLSCCHPFHPGGYDPPPSLVAGQSSHDPTALSPDAALHGRL